MIVATKTRSRKIKINPREPLTKKAKAAILVYAYHYAKRHGEYGYILVEGTLKAERMKREKLYEVLQERGYRWSPRTGWNK
jgi:hypothetical protein